MPLIFYDQNLGCLKDNGDFVKKDEVFIDRCQPYKCQATGMIEPIPRKFFNAESIYQISYLFFILGECKSPFKHISSLKGCFYYVTEAKKYPDAVTHCRNYDNGGSCITMMIFKAFVQGQVSSRTEEVMTELGKEIFNQVIKLLKNACIPIIF